MALSLDDRIASKQTSNTCFVTTSIIGGCIGSACIAIGTLGFLYAHGHLSLSSPIAWIKNLSTSSNQWKLWASLSAGVVTVGGSLAYVVFHYYKNKQIEKDECMAYFKASERYFEEQNNPISIDILNLLPNKSCRYTNKDDDWYIGFTDEHSTLNCSDKCTEQEKNRLLLFFKAEGYNISQL